ncbi:hypothetical protein SAMN04487950_0688 [Halogranum rubrum]|uniref:Uncharacterized protein n=1 Tax=Halogranum rubrum TaxID=553466 RepID=A0A1I4BRU7_9EURY|nr:hypothetical protein [Halogranum rubrum]SFK70591.1 hypothetical protein SAMN04487950_0688 [Halogranum rubrum]
MADVVALQIISQLRPIFDLVVPVFVVGFFLAALVAIVLSRNRTVRTTYLAGFFVLLLVVNLFAPVTPAPVIKWHKFSEVRDTEQTEYAFRVVDADGTELMYDEDATLNTGSVALSLVRLRMQNEFSSEKNAEVAQWLLDRANTRRTSVEAASPARFLSFPRHGMSNAWTAEKLAGYSEFTSIRLYQIDITTSEDGTEVVAYDETLLYEYHEDRGTVLDFSVDSDELTESVVSESIDSRSRVTATGGVVA